MKKIIAAALSLLVGAFGFTIVDKTIEQRVSDLEYSVSSLEEQINTSKLPVVPNVSAFSKEDAQKILTQAGYKVIFDYQHSDMVKEGYVVSNSLANTVALPGTTITVVVSLGDLETEDTTITVTSKWTTTEPDITTDDFIPSTDDTTATAHELGPYSYGYYNLTLPKGIKSSEGLSYFYVEYSVYNNDRAWECTAWLNDESCKVRIGANENSSRIYTFYINGFKYFTCTAVNEDGKIYAENIKYYPYEPSDFMTTTTTRQVVESR